MAAPSASDKWRFTLYSTFVLVILFNPWTYSLVNSLLSRFIGQTATGNGCPTPLGFAIHVIIFTLIIRYMMDLGI
uniref:Uncharacterized protein n=1 Tax=viral metagenome TaxID=1070528 RepID=A0A6C0B8D4_9ZZZZ